ncbi:MAG: DUF2102 family protein [Candidatus Methanohalarchaeum thermophilum]|uniref:DUF2102 family protein n=1 Tax=Methanohalarchaeum thermophilum TaxID=1903181 RepID=A0A1Q6DVJ5_METT1|nr:MAG: DUF2102 family protein [Candidatus Methanohalarchaeum thermophilum]
METRIIVISPASSLTPSYVAKVLHKTGLSLTVKETCFGVIIEGNEKDIKKAVEKVRDLNSEEVYIKERGFPVADKRRCRAEHGSRPGFCQLQSEYETMSYLSKSSSEEEEEEEKKEKEGKLDVEDLEKLVKEEAD